DVEGVKDKEGNLISTLYVEEIEDLIRSEVVKGGMIPKLKSARKAIKEGVKKVHIIDGRLPHSVLIELFTDEGLGTQILSKGDGNE
ncbi:MAG: acetylglutamate kinase, partial [Caldimicrobium sp.]